MHKSQEKKNVKEPAQTKANDVETSSPAQTKKELTTEEQIELNKQAFAAKMSKQPAVKNSTSKANPKQQKEARTWDGVPAGPKEVLDRSDKRQVDERHNDVIVGVTDVEDDTWIREEEAPSSGIFKSFFDGITGNKVLKAEEVARNMDEFKQHLINKNVASDIADKLCASVAESLEGQKCSSLSSIKNLIKPAMQSALVRILTPRRHIDILRDALEAKKKTTGRTLSLLSV